MPLWVFFLGLGRSLCALFDLLIAEVVFYQVELLVFMSFTCESVIQNFQIVVTICGYVHEVLQVCVKIRQFTFLLFEYCLMLIVIF